MSYIYALIEFFKLTFSKDSRYVFLRAANKGLSLRDRSGDWP